MNNDETRCGISEAARQVPCSEGTLRIYDLKGIVSPVRDVSGRRLFSESDIKSAKEYRAKSK